MQQLLVTTKVGSEYLQPKKASKKVLQDIKNTNYYHFYYYLPNNKPRLSVIFSQSVSFYVYVGTCVWYT